MKPAPLVAALPASTPFVGPERLMRERGSTELVRLGANESAFGTSPNAIAAMASELPHLAWYGDPDSLALRDALAAKHACDVDELLVTSGIDDAMGLAVRAYLAPGAVAVASRGTYPTFAYHVTGYGGVLETVDYRDDGVPDLDALARRAHDSSAAIVYLANPDNPSGSFLARAEIERLYDALPQQTMLFLDEAYADFVSAGELAPRLGDRLLRTRTFSKGYGMAGARIGYAIAAREVIAQFHKVRLQYGVNRNAQIGALASLRDAAFLDGVVRETASGREDYYALARDLGFPALRSQTNFVCIDVGDAARATRIVAELLKRGVWIRKPGAPPLDRCIRIGVGTAPMRDVFAAALRASLDEVSA